MARHHVVTLAISSTLAVGGTAVVPLAGSATAAAAAGTIRLATPSNPVLKGDRITLQGRFPKQARRTFVIQKAKPSSNRWSTVKGAGGKTTRRGTFTSRFVPGVTQKYRAVLPATKTSGAKVSSTVTVKVVKGWRSIAAGDYHTCGVRYDGSGWCWGSASNGKLGRPAADVPTGASSTPLRLPDPVAGQRWVSLSLGAQHTCGLLTNQTLWCWGGNYNQQLGRPAGGTPAENATPLQVTTSEGNRFTQLAAGAYFNCAIATTKALWCWGTNKEGQLGVTTESGTTTGAAPSKVASPVPEVQSWREVATGEEHTCAVLSNSTLWCFGSNAYGESGPGQPVDANPHPTPAQVPAPTGSWAAVEIGGDSLSHSCGLLTNGTARCWGNNSAGQLGHAATSGSNSQPSPLPVGAPFDKTVASLTLGFGFTCGLLPTGKARCWGVNTYGQLGNTTKVGTTEANPNPLAVPGSAWLQLSAGEGHTCGILADHQVFCWGLNAAGQLGSATNQATLNPNPTPIKVPLPPG